ncbi:hypothetical protein NSQ62_08345 [Solibacillus sp. FSL H8-0523]|uniref:hypothetical protein n=1 Tax=Solibacillus sp. FSL H8-0523 TaxID=2954511 RepID=UPI003101B234
MKLVVYCPSNTFEPSQNTEAVYTYADLINKIKTGNYEAVYAYRPESYSKNRIQYHEIMNAAIDNGTKLFETYSDTELTASFIKERSIPFSRSEFEIIKRFIEQKNLT